MAVLVSAVRFRGQASLFQPSWPGLSRPSTSGRAAICRGLSTVTRSSHSHGYFFGSPRRGWPGLRPAMTERVEPFFIAVCLSEAYQPSHIDPHHGRAARCQADADIAAEHLVDSRVAGIGQEAVLAEG